MTLPQMYTSQSRDIRNTKKQGNMTPPKLNNSTVTNTNDSEVE
jgi:hypothetical protein